MDELSIREKSVIAEFVSNEQGESPEWFLKGSTQNFASPAEIVVYFTAFCLALKHVNSALKEIDEVLKRVKSIFSSWNDITEKKEDDAAELKIEEEIVLAVYRAMCSGTGGVATGQIAAELGVSEEKVEQILSKLTQEGIVSRGERTLQWILVVT